MFEALKSKLLPSSQAEQALLEACLPLDDFGQGLAKAACQYILKGDSADCLGTLSHLRHQHKLPCPGWLRDRNDERQAAVTQAMVAFLSSEFASQQPIWHRLGLLCHACHGNEALYTVETPISGWLGNLILLLGQLLDPNEGEALPLAAVPSRAFMVQLAAAYDLPPHWVDAYILESRAYYTNELVDAWQDSTDWGALAETAQFQGVLAQTHARARATFCKLLAKADYQPASTGLALLMQLAADGNSEVRKTALVLIAGSDAALRLAFLEANYLQGSAEQRGRWLDVAEQTPGGEALLASWQQAESSKPLKQRIAERLDYLDQQRQAQSMDWQLPPLAPLDSDTTVPAHWLERLQQKRQQCIDEAISDIAASEQKLARLRAKGDNLNHDEDFWLSHHQRNLESDQSFLAILQAISDADLAAVLDELAQGTLGSRRDPVSAHLKRTELWREPGIPLVLYLRLRQVGTERPLWEQLLNEADFAKLCSQQLTDLRQLLALAQAEDLYPDALLSSLFKRSYSGQAELPLCLTVLPVWPLLVEHPQHLDAALKDKLLAMDTRYDDNDVLGQALLLLGQLPKLPPHWQNTLYQYALDTRVTLRQLAQASAEKLGVDITLVTPALADTSKEVRSLAASWLGRLGATEAQGALAKAMAKEKDFPTRALMLEALEQAGGDIQAFLSPQAVLAEAEAGLKKAAPKSMDWFPHQHLPQCRFADGSPAPQQLLYWWAVLAVKLKQPQGNLVLTRYLQLLDQDSRQRLGHFVLSAFIAWDCRCPSDTEADQYAQQNKQSRFSQYQRWAKYDWGQQYANKTLEDAYQDCFNEKKSELLGTAIKEKGLLALCTQGEPQGLLALIRPFMKQHFARRAQIEAMLSALGGSDDPVLIQFLLAIARRYRTNSVQELARNLVAAIAERNDWTQDELADRTIQTAGLDKVTGPSPFEFGSRTLALSLGDDLKLCLQNEEGKVLKALPQPRQNDDEAAVAEVKKWFSACKKEIKQVVEQQSARLYEAMVTGRQWPASDWRQYLHQHPVMFRLLQRSLWQVQLDGQWHSFRPTEDGAFIDLDDEELTLPATAPVRLLSANLLDQDAAKGWRRHLKDYKVKPLFEQLQQAEITLTPQQLALDHGHGRLTDCFTLRGLLTKKGYQRGQPQDGGFFDHYFKDFDSLGIRVEFAFSGNCVPEENETAAIYGIKAMQLDRESRAYYPYTQLPLAEVPANLLNAMAVDYQEVADKCVEDPQWEKKLPW
ncbi:DUF4132 domain-containing protein [Gallaecimonas xiamenensis]|uniref:PBS lyase HEAT domain protein repeat-containing protein n=1 Tax=Gallaecimonas xiamenensis 3-C-1 TaxID=745411 RepID=K2JFM5_9GAMM|nr:DUF4132 domain-containing protein [Gallaecimonas xiamenensis]EKE69459.1 PBS lyase HEAT domain protein repeat-containing protein [Gallaecimonas xiamenensis 3-C-1]